jgi:hypothetical protein
MTNVVTCENCRFFQHYPADGAGNTGDCRRHAPQQSEYTHQTARWPIVHTWDWCGEAEAVEQTMPWNRFRAGRATA